MGIYYSTECDNIGNHVPSCCGDDELGRVRSYGFIHKSVMAAILADPTLTATWLTYIASKQIQIIPNSQGSFAPSEKTGPGFGSEAMKMMGYDNKLSVKDPDYTANNVTWNNLLKRSNRYYAFYCTETKIHFSERVVTVIPKTPVADDITGKMVIESDIVWSSQDMPVPYTIPENVIDCFLVTA